MADSFVQFETLLREFISPAAIDLEFKDDDPAWNLIGTFQPETVGGSRVFDSTASDFPAGYEAVTKIKVQTGGRVSGGNFSGNTLVMMGKDSHLAMGQAADAKYLDPRKTPLRAYIDIRMILLDGLLREDYSIQISDHYDLREMNEHDYLLVFAKHIFL